MTVVFEEAITCYFQTLRQGRKVMKGRKWKKLLVSSIKT